MGQSLDVMECHREGMHDTDFQMTRAESVLSERKIPQANLHCEHKTLAKPAGNILPQTAWQYTHWKKTHGIPLHTPRLDSASAI